MIRISIVSYVYEITFLENLKAISTRNLCDPVFWFTSANNAAFCPTLIVLEFFVACRCVKYDILVRGAGGRGGEVALINKYESVKILIHKKEQHGR